MKKEYKKDFKEYISNIENMIKDIKIRYTDLEKKKDADSIKEAEELKKEEQALLTNVAMAKAQEQIVDNLFAKLKKLEENQKSIISTIEATEDDEDLVDDLKKAVIGKYKTRFDEINKEIKTAMKPLDDIKKTNVLIKSPSNLGVVKQKKAPRKVRLTKEQRENIENNINNPRIFNRVAEAQGINIKSRSKATKAEKDALKKKVYDKLVEIQKGQKELLTKEQIKQILTQVYGADFSNKKKKSASGNSSSKSSNVGASKSKSVVVKPASNTKKSSKTKKKPTVQNKPKKKTVKKPRDPEDLLYEALKGLDFSYRKDDKKYQKINYKCKESFKQSTHQGNYIKNFFGFFSGGVKSGIMWLQKKKAQIQTTAEDHDRYDELKKRINTWSYEEVVAFRKYYKGNLPLNLGDVPEIFDTITLERLRELIMNKVGKINEEIIDIHNQIYDAFDIVKDCDAKLSKKNISSKDKKELQAKKKKALSGKAKLIDRYGVLKTEGDALLEGDALHDAEETKKAKTNRGSMIGGKYLSKKHRFDEELFKKEHKLRTEYKDAIKNKDDEKALKKFVEFQQLEIKNTKIESTFPLGTRSVGKRYYDPTVVNLDYSEDSLVRDIFVTCGLILTAWNVTRAISNAIANSKNIAAQNHDILAANKQNKQNIIDAHNVSKQIKGTRGTIQKGMKAQAYSDTVNGFNVNERGDMDMVDWDPSKAAYHVSDHHNHNLMEQLSADIHKDFKHVQNMAKSGQHVSPNVFINIANKYNNSFAKAIKQSIAESTAYAARHPNIKLGGYLKDLKYLETHVGDIAKMNAASLKNTYIVEALDKLKPTYVNQITGISDNLKYVLIQAGATGALLAKTAMYGTTLSAKYNAYGYGNPAINRIEQSLDGYQVNTSNVNSGNDSIETTTEQNTSSDKLKDLQNMKTNMKNNAKKNRKASISAEAKVVQQIQGLNSNSNIIYVNNGKQNAIVVSGDISKATLPVGYQYKNGVLTNRGSVDEDKVVEFDVYKEEDLQTLLASNSKKRAKAKVKK